MSRIKKRGLDYFPLDIDFLQNRLVRRIMKREGDGALATLVSAFSCIYGGEGYYVLTDAFFYEDISASYGSPLRNNAPLSSKATSAPSAIPCGKVSRRYAKAVGRYVSREGFC